MGVTQKLDLKQSILAQAKNVGFDVVGIADPTEVGPIRDRLRQFLQHGRHGTMDWLAANEERRSNPRVLWPDVRSVVMLGMNYGPEGDPLGVLGRRDHGAISVYAQGRDYHDVVKRKLKQIARWLQENHGGEVKVFVDTAPVMEKPLARAAGIGWQGKHTNLVSRELGSWLFLGAVFTTIDIQPDHPEADHCGGCRACLDVCPTDAFPAPYEIDARRCISYLTIEHGGHISRELRSLIGNRIYGCDDCLAVCPWNKFARVGAEMALMPRPGLDAPPLAALVTLDDADFRRLFSGSPIKRIGRARFVRNVLIAIGNSKNPAFSECVALRLEDESPLVRAMAVWALGMLVEPGEMKRLRLRHEAREDDLQVIEEWQAACVAEPANCLPG